MKATKQQYKRQIALKIFRANKLFEKWLRSVVPLALLMFILLKTFWMYKTWAFLMLSQSSFRHVIKRTSRQISNLKQDLMNQKALEKLNSKHIRRCKRRASVNLQFDWFISAERSAMPEKSMRCRNDYKHVGREVIFRFSWAFASSFDVDRSYW